MGLLQSHAQRPLPMRSRKNLDSPGAGESDIAHGGNESGHILVSLPDKFPVISGVLEQSADHLVGCVADLDAEDHIGAQALAQLIEHGIGTEYVPVIDNQSCSRMIGQSNQFRALRYRSNHAEWQRLERDPGAMSLSLLSQLPQRNDERFQIVDPRCTVGADLDEGRFECLCSFEKLVPMRTPAIIVPPPPRTEFDLDMPKSCGCDLGGKPFVSD